ncbi:hypothetical protein [uncultured Imperialibacter sp.]|uniref:hypothetical protein n=1 Tax=uncultured Imperialibacter sp. TaxID=1672639 RepID=UPI0030DCD0E9|tara:strand:+ start:10454 stop:10849 length:396 start_codon:yes stop_codon:yes gene_type:complete
MLKNINFKLAVHAMIALLSLVLVYHLTIITGLIPYEATWGGRLQNREQMLRFETVSILVNLFILTVILIKGGYLKLKLPTMVLKVLLWAFAVLFALNTVGNLASTSVLELIIFTPLTAAAAVFCARLAIEP